MELGMFCFEGFFFPSHSLLANKNQRSLPLNKNGGKCVENLRVRLKHENTIWEGKKAQHILDDDWAALMVHVRTMVRNVQSKLTQYFFFNFLHGYRKLNRK